MIIIERYCEKIPPFQQTSGVSLNIYLIINNN